MNNTRLQDTLISLNIPNFIQHADNAVLARMIARTQNEDTQQPTPERLPRYAFVYEQRGIDLYKHFISGAENIERKNIYDCFYPDNVCWRPLAFLPEQADQAVNGHVSEQSLRIVKEDLQEDLLQPALLLPFHLSVSGMLGGRIAETRLDLERCFHPADTHSADPWRKVVLDTIFSAFILLVRKAKGWQDIHLAIQNLTTLRLLQHSYEERYLEKQGSPTQQTLAALELVGLYNLAQLISLVGEYLSTGQLGFDRVNSRMDRHYEQAIEALEAGQHLLLAHLADLLWIGCKELVRNSTWTHISQRLSKLMQEYLQWLTSPENPQPLLELWPSQQEALRSHLLTSYYRAIIVTMPTSAGKTQLAKFAIIQAKGSRTEGLIAYIVPTRALVNQVTLDLRMNFRGLLRVEQTIPVTELDPTEIQFLQGSIDVLVTTPEKLDLLVKSKHPVTKNIILAIVDEAHNLNDKDRGVRLELLLGTIKLDFPDAQFLLLSPFLPNSQELVQWLGAELALLPIKIDWKPNRKLVGTVRSVKNHHHWLLEFETLDCIDMQDAQAGMKITIGQTHVKLETQEALTRATVSAFLNRGVVLILCKGPGTAMKRASEIARERAEIAKNEKLEAFCHYIEAEIGKNSSLPTCLRRGVVYHHSGLSSETRWLIEDLIRDHTVDVICGTTTLAQGVNFPITTVVIETLQKGRSKLTAEDFRNIAGRAGRTLVDTLGVIAFPAPKPVQKQKVQNLLKEDAQNVVRQLIDIIKKAEAMGIQFTISALRENPGLSSLLQFLAHAMRVAGNENLANDVEELLRSSLVYYQLQKQDQKLARTLIRICRSYIEQTNRRKNILHLADQTGFATPSVLALLSQKEKQREFSAPLNWTPARLFGDDLQPLAKRIDAVASLPEILFDKDKDIRFDASFVAGILRDWVKGKTIEEMTLHYGKMLDERAVHPKKSSDDAGIQLANFSKYLFSLLSRASWGISSLEKICLSGNERTDWDEVGHVPSMIFFGVDQKEAVWLRMAGVPRVIANPLANVWKAQARQEPASYQALRDWVTDLSDNDWQKVLPSDIALSAQDMRLVWKSLSGE